jgi:DNA repair exonuclease SbcCD ATPase subunit
MEAKKMNASKLIRYLDDQNEAIEALIAQLDEVQVAFNAQFDEFKARHDATLDRLTDQIADDLSASSPQLVAAIEERLPEERQRIDERRQNVREEYLPKRQQAADDLLNKAQAELAELRALNPQLDAQEEELKAEKAGLEARLAKLNEEIRKLSRGLGVVRHFLAITKADQERQRVIGKLELINNSLRQVRQSWEQKREETEQHQADLQNKWQLEGVAVARLQSELDQLDDEARREDLALRRAIRNVLDNLKEILPSPQADLDAELRQMVELNIRTDAYHEGLASVGGMIGLLRGISSGNAAIRQSVEGLQNEQQMHSAYLKPLDFQLPSSVETFHKQWADLARQFADEVTIGAHPADFSSAVEPLLAGPLSESSIEEMFNSLGRMIQQATAQW